MEGNNFRETFRMIECGDLDLNFEIEEGILFFGFTKAGKTTTCHYLSRQLLKGDKNDVSRLVYKASPNSQYSSAIIGNKESTSETQIPNFFKANFIRPQLFLIDCPGYGDSQGCERIISNGYFHYKVFSKVKKVKFLITIEFQGLSGAALLLKHTFSSFYKGFENYEGNQQDILEATGVMITKVPITKDLEYIRTTLWNNLSAIKINGTECNAAFHRLRNRVFEKQRLFIFKEPEDIDKSCNINNHDLEKIDSSLKPWEVNNMSSIKISITEKLLSSQISPDLKFLSEYLTTQIKDKIKFLYQVLKALVSDAYGPEKSYTFCTEIENYYQRYIKDRETNDDRYKRYEPKRKQVRERLFLEDKSSNEKTVKSSSASAYELPFWMKKIKVIDNIFNISEEIMKYDEHDIRMNTFRLNSTITILQDLVWLCNQADKKKACKFCYEIYRLIDLTNNINRIMSLQNQQKQKQSLMDPESIFMFIHQEYPAEFNDSIKRIFEESVITQKINYVKNYQTKGKSELTDRKHVQSIIEFFDDVILKIKSLQNSDLKEQIGLKSQEEIEQDLEIINQKKIEIQLAYYSAKVIDLKAKEVAPTLRNLNILFEEIEQIFNNMRLDGIDNPNINMARIKVLSLIGQVILKFQGNENLAIMIYDFLKNPMKIFKIFDDRWATMRRISSKDSDKMKFFEAYMKMAKRYQRRELALEKAHEVYNYAQSTGDYEKMQQICEEIKGLTKNYQPYEKICSWISEDIKTKEVPVDIIQKLQQLFYSDSLDRQPEIQMTPIG